MAASELSPPDFIRDTLELGNCQSTAFIPATTAGCCQRRQHRIARRLPYHPRLIPASVIESVLVAARQIREPITIMTLVAASAAQHLTQPVPVIEPLPPKPRLFRSIPTYCLDRHTASGNQAIRRWLVESQRLGDTIGQYVPDHKSVAVAGYSVFHVEGWVIANRWDWPLSRQLQQIGARIDLEKSGCSPEGVEPVLAAALDELPHLNEIRCRLLERRPRPPRQPSLPLDREA